MSTTEGKSSGRLDALDGWRGLSIVFVLAAHLLPLGPKAWQLNFASGLAGMSLFFALSGLLITRFLIARPAVVAFLVRRLFRILPLAWLLLVLLLPLTWQRGWPTALQFLLVQNYLPGVGNEYTSHYWSLCVEMHFYLAVALLVAVGGARALLCLPVLALAVTLGRVWTGTYADVATHARVDEILSGATLALVMHGDRLLRLRRAIERLPVLPMLLLWAASCHPLAGPLNYVRPYLAAGLIGASLLGHHPRLFAILSNRWLRYLAETSYALYVIHGPLRAGWFGTGSTFERYLIKRPITFIVTFGLAHLSTRHFESYFIGLGKRLSR